MTTRPRTAFIEHVNLSVSDPARSAALMIALFGWHIRWQGTAADGGHTIHVGSDTAYLALYQAANTDHTPLVHSKGQPLNHVGIQVDDLTAVDAACRTAGLVPFGHDDYEPGRRFYMVDFDGIEFEIVSYA